MDSDELARLIDPDAWAARVEDQVTFGAQWEFDTRRAASKAAADRIRAAGYAVVKRAQENCR